MGDTRYDINGRACSVEFYFGLDCLLTASGDPFPVRWTGYDNAINGYQGELVPRDKKTVQERIDQMLTSAEAGGSPLDDRWDAMRKIAQTIIAAAESQPQPRVPDIYATHCPRSRPIRERLWSVKPT
jgi:hypothetical protein